MLNVVFFLPLVVAAVAALCVALVSRRWQLAVMFAPVSGAAGAALTVAITFLLFVYTFEPSPGGGGLGLKDPPLMVVIPVLAITFAVIGGLVGLAATGVVLGGRWIARRWKPGA